MQIVPTPGLEGKLQLEDPTDQKITQAKTWSTAVSAEAHLWHPWAFTALVILSSTWWNELTHSNE